MYEREQLTEKILAAKRRLGLQWSTIAAAIGPGSPVIYTAALLGQFTLTPEEAAKAATLLELDPADAVLLTESPSRGSDAIMPPTDPLIYRFYEIVQTYGTTMKTLIEEEFGDGIMSAIDFTMSIDRVPDPKGDRVKVELNGKFLPYKRF